MAGEYLCKDGETCIQDFFRCDGHNDCPQNDDEENCTLPVKAHENVDCGADFECLDDKTCLPMELVCDGIKQCMDGSDELACLDIRKKCVNGFVCTNGHCLSDISWMCDGYNDCGDNSDEEANCSKYSVLNERSFQENSNHLCQFSLLL